MTNQPEALRLADALCSAKYPDHLDAMAADELRRQYAEIERLTAALTDRAREASKAHAEKMDEFVAHQKLVKELQAKLAEMEKQEPTAIVCRSNDLSGVVDWVGRPVCSAGAKLYAAAGAAPVPDMLAGWIRACDDEMISAHLGVANLSDSYESAKAKLNELISWHVAVATDPAVNGGYQLVPLEPTQEM